MNYDYPQTSHRRSSLAVFAGLVPFLVLSATLAACGGDGGSASQRVRGTVAGLTTPGLVIANGPETLSISPGTPDFSFSTELPSGSGYSVTIKEQPTTHDQVCSIGRGSGTIGQDDPSAVQVACHSTQWNVSTYAGSGVFGSADGSSTSASFANPLNVAVDATGTVFVADSFNHRIRKVAAGGTVTTLAGSGVVGASDGVGAAASFNYPKGIATDAIGNVYVADSGNFKVRIISPAGVVTTLAGSGSIGASDGIGAAASFSNLGGLALDSSGNVYVADTGNSKVRRISQSGTVTTVAGTGVPGASNGPAATATFFGPTGVAIDTAGTIYVADDGNNLVRKISTAGDVSTLAGSGSQTIADGTGSAASFASLVGVATDKQGNLFVVDFGRIRKITASGVVTTIAGSFPFGSSDGTGFASSFNGPSSIAIDTDGKIYVGDGGNFKIRLILAQ